MFLIAEVAEEFERERVRKGKRQKYTSREFASNLWKKLDSQIDNMIKEVDFHKDKYGIEIEITGYRLVFIDRSILE